MQLYLAMRGRLWLCQPLTDECSELAGVMSHIDFNGEIGRWVHAQIDTLLAANLKCVRNPP